ncbi:MAG: urea ABC transporter permease subunit UrtB [Cellvibrionaceae bacterium]|nr:urea ABC transporter permease subunit UrtB [Cellvibrionaceae bacterium]|tara:strand:- start:5555 stop:7252 length:1698 start_codon:yes stop_codon:yes gene_type:complete
MMAVGCLFLLLLGSGGAKANSASVSTELSKDVEINSSVPVDVTERTSAEALLEQLTHTKLSKAAALLEQLEQSGDVRVRAVFQTMLDGALYYQRDNRQLLAVRKGEDKSLNASDVFSGESLGVVAKKSVKKIRVNNRLRVYLRGALSRLALNADSADDRNIAVMSMLDKLSADNVAALQALDERETNHEVKVSIALALAMNTLATSSDRDQRLAAIEVMDGRLEAPVKNQLRALVDSAVVDGSIVNSSLDTQVIAAAQKALQNIDGKVTAYGYVEQLFFGLSLGSVLLLAAIGLAITFGVMGVINMAHGEMIMIGAYATFVVQQLMPNFLEYSIWVAIPAAFLTAGLVGVLIERCVIRYLHGRPLETLLATFGISLILQQAVRTIFSPLNQTVVTPEWMSGSLEINAVLSITYSRIYIFIFALIVFAALQLVMKKTSLGLQVRAVSQNRSMAKSMGIHTDRVDALTFGLGSGIAGIAGVALSQITNVGPNLGQAYIIDSFMVVVFGGVGNLLGTLFAGFSLGIANKFLEPATGAVLANIIVLIFIILFMQKRPKGLFPQKGRAAE